MDMVSMMCCPRRVPENFSANHMPYSRAALECSEPSRGIKIFLIMFPPRSSDGNPRDRYRKYPTKRAPSSQGDNFKESVVDIPKHLSHARPVQHLRNHPPETPAAKLASSA